MPNAMLWNVQYATPETFTNAGTFAAALRQHLQYTPAGLTSVLLQIGEEQAAYVLQAGCAGCALDRCLPGCRVDLLRRVLATGYAESALVLVRRGLVERPYTRTVIGWPDTDAKPLDASVLQGWTFARLQLHWRRRCRIMQGLQTSVVLQVGDGTADPLQRLRAIGWRAVAASWLRPWLGDQPRPAPWWLERPWPHDPYLLTPVAATTHWLMSPPTRFTSARAIEEAAGYGNAAAIVHHLHEAGARIEMLDLDEDGWKAQVAATTVAGAHPRPVFEALRTPGAPVEVCDIETGTLVLDPSQARPHAATPPLLFVGVRSHGARRWRPLSATHHIVLSGPIEGGVILGMLAPALESHGLRVGVLDLTANGRLAAALIDLPGRLPTTDGHNPSELLHAIGSLADQEQLTVVVLAVDDAAAAEAAMIPFLRAAMYRPLSVLLVVPDMEAIPAAIQHRCPLIQVRQRVARWQAPEGRWEWARPTVLRLPWRDPHLSWSSLLQHGKRHKVQLPALDGFWALPLDLQTTLGDAFAQVVPDDVVAGPDTAGQADVAQSDGGDGLAPLTAEPGPPEGAVLVPVARRQGGSRVYSLPIERSAAERASTPWEPSTAPSLAAGMGDGPEPAAQAPAMPAAAQSQATAAPQQAAVSVPRRTPVSAPPLPTLPGAAPTSEHAAYSPQEDSAGNLIVDQRLLVIALRWAEQIGQDERGVPMTRFKSALHLPSKAHSRQLVEALRIHGLIRREVREGWYELLTVEEAVRVGKLPPGPWYTPQAADRAPDTPAVVDPRQEGADHDVVGVPSHGAHVNAPLVTDSEVVA